MCILVYMLKTLLFLTACLRCFELDMLRHISSCCGGSRVLVGWLESFFFFFFLMVFCSTPGPGQTDGLEGRTGLTLKAGRFLSGLGFRV